MEFNQETIATIVAAVSLLSVFGGMVAGMFNSERAKGVKGFFLKVAKFAGGNTYKNQTGMSIPFTPFDIGAKTEPDEG